MTFSVIQGHWRWYQLKVYQTELSIVNSNTMSYEIPNSTSIANSFTARCYASAVYAVDVCPSDGWQ